MPIELLDAHGGSSAITSSLSRRLSASYGVQTTYLDLDGRTVAAEPECLLEVLRTLGAPLDGPDRFDPGALTAALRERRRARVRRVLPPVAAVWDDAHFGVRMIVPAALGSKSVTAALTLESGEHREWAPSARTVLRSVSVDDVAYFITRLPLPSLPHGYHRLTVSFDGLDHECLIVRAPTRTYREPGRGRQWGLFAPLYALHSRRSAGVGNFEDLEAFAKWTRAHGGAFVATLPFLASFPGEASPYSPISRLFWNELFVACGGEEPPDTLLDYQALHAKQKERLRTWRTSPDALAAFQEHFPLALDYARFRAVVSVHGADWHRWPEPLRTGPIEAADVDARLLDETRHHLKSQLACETQLARIDSGLYLDFPLGVHGNGYDTWREQTLFAHDVAVGAPPDAAFPSGQNWSTPPVLPYKSREQAHRYFRLSVRHAMRHAELLRIDHVMGLHRQFWIPRGADVGSGVYVRYPCDDLYAVLSLESHRARCELIGENLGIVPDVVGERMRRHGIRGLYVHQLAPDAEIPKDAVASLNTHDTETFAAFADGRREARDGALRALLRSDADLVSIAVEDLWLERERHNVPGTTDEHPNWRRPMRYPLEEFDLQIGDVVDTLER